MLNAGIFVDAENVNRCGGWTMRYDVLKAFVAAQGFLHGSDLEAGAFKSDEMARLDGQRHVIEFAITDTPDGKKKAIDAGRLGAMD